MPGGPVFPGLPGSPISPLSPLKIQQPLNITTVMSKLYKFKANSKFLSMATFKAVKNHEGAEKMFCQNPATDKLNLKHRQQVYFVQVSI